MKKINFVPDSSFERFTIFFDFPSNLPISEDISYILLTAGPAVASSELEDGNADAQREHADMLALIAAGNGSEDATPEELAEVRELVDDWN